MACKSALAIACDVTTASGAVTQHVSFPWREWGSLLLFAAAIACAVLAVTRGRRLIIGSGAAMLMAGAFGVWFTP